MQHRLTGPPSALTLSQGPAPRNRITFAALGRSLRQRTSVRANWLRRLRFSGDRACFGGVKLWTCVARVIKQEAMQESIARGEY